MSVRVESKALESTGNAAPVRNEFLDSLSGRNDFIDSLSGRNQFLDSLSGYRIDGATSVEETIFVPSSDEERIAANARAAGSAFEDEEADDVFEQSLSGLKIDGAEVEEVEVAGTIGIEPPPAQTLDLAVNAFPVVVNDPAENLRYSEIVGLPRQERAIDSDKRKSSLGALARAAIILLYGLAAFAVGSAVTMRAFDLPHDIPPMTDVQVLPAASQAYSPPNGMVLVTGGNFKMGSDEGDAFSRPEHLETIRSFFIDQTEVTNKAYLEFVEATGHGLPQTWVNGKFSIGEERFPVTGVTWYDAAEYAAWSGKRLPTEVEWEYAARGSDGRVYPWGNEWEGSSLNAEGAAKGARAVGQGGRSPFGAFDMAGNVWEWTSSDAKGFSGGKQIPWSRHRLKIIRGGNWQSDKRTATTFFRGFYGASGEKDYKGTGFRCVKDIPREK